MLKLITEKFKVNESYGKDYSNIPEVKTINYVNKKNNLLPGVTDMKSFIKALEEVGLDKFKVRTTRFPLSGADIKDEWMSFNRNGWSIIKAYDSSLKGFNEVVICSKLNKVTESPVINDDAYIIVNFNDIANYNLQDYEIQNDDGETLTVFCHTDIDTVADVIYIADIDNAPRAKVNNAVVNVDYIVVYIDNPYETHDYVEEGIPDDVLEEEITKEILANKAIYKCKISDFENPDTLSFWADFELEDGNLIDIAYKNESEIVNDVIKQL